MTRVLRLLLMAAVSIFSGTVMASPRATLSIENERSERVQVWVDHSSVGEVRANSHRSIRFRAGRHDVQIRTKEGRLVKEMSVSLTPSRTSHVVIPPAMGTLVLNNPTSKDLELKIDQQTKGMVPAGATRSFQLEEGAHRIQVGTVVIGRDVRVLDQRIRISENGRRSLRLEAPQMGFVRVENRAGRAGVLYVDDKRHQMMDPGQVVILELPVGSAQVSFKQRERVIDSMRAEVRPFQAVRFNPEIRMGSLRVHNPLRIPVWVTVDGHSKTLVEAHSSRLFGDLMTGEIQVRIEDPHGLFIERMRTEIRAGSRNSVRVPEPTMALLELHSDRNQRADVFVDSQRVATLEARQSLRLAIEPGTHRVQVRDPNGGILVNRLVTVDLYESLALRVEGDSSSRSTASNSHMRPGEAPSGQVYVVD